MSLPLSCKRKDIPTLEDLTWLISMMLEDKQKVVPCTWQWHFPSWVSPHTQGDNPWGRPSAPAAARILRLLSGPRSFLSASGLGETSS